MRPLVLKEGFPERVLRGAIVLALVASILVFATVGLRAGFELTFGAIIALGFLGGTMWAARKAQRTGSFKPFGVAALVKYPIVVAGMFLGFQYLEWDGRWLALGAGVVIATIGLRLVIELVFGRSRATPTAGPARPGTTSRPMPTEGQEARA